MEDQVVDQAAKQAADLAEAQALSAGAGVSQGGSGAACNGCRSESA